MIRLQTRLKLRFFAYTAVCLLIGFVAGFTFRMINHKCHVVKPAQNEDLNAKIHTETKTVVRYVEKESPKDADVDVTIPKQSLTVKVNGHEQTFKKSDTEKYVLDKTRLPWTSSPRRALTSRCLSSMRPASGSWASAWTKKASPLAWSVSRLSPMSAGGLQEASPP